MSKTTKALQNIRKISFHMYVIYFIQKIIDNISIAILLIIAHFRVATGTPVLF